MPIKGYNYIGGKLVDIYFECLPCLLRQALEASRLATDDIELQKEIMKQAALSISDYQSYQYAPEIGRVLHNIVKNTTGVSDPYEDIKEKSIKAAEELYHYLKMFLYKKQDRIYWALKISATGNIIDAAINCGANVDNLSCIESEIEKEFTICDVEYFKSKLQTCKKLLIIGDNSGETIFDRVLIEDMLNHNITYAVRSEAIINDVTLKDAIDSKLDTCTTIVSTGCNAPGLIIEECTDDFKRIYYEADIVISKGQGNYETLSGQSREIFFLLKAKCSVLADLLGVNVGDYIFKCNSIK